MKHIGYRIMHKITLEDSRIMTVEHWKRHIYTSQLQAKDAIKDMKKSGVVREIDEFEIQKLYIDEARQT